MTYHDMQRRVVVLSADTASSSMTWSILSGQGQQDEHYEKMPLHATKTLKINTEMMIVFSLPSANTSPALVEATMRTVLTKGEKRK